MKARNIILKEQVIILEKHRGAPDSRSPPQVTESVCSHSNDNSGHINQLLLSGIEKAVHTLDVTKPKLPEIRAFHKTVMDDKLCGASRNNTQRT